MTNYSYKRSERLAQQLRREIGRVLQFEVNDPRLQYVTVTSVNLSDNLKNATIYVTIFGENKNEVFTNLTKAGSFIRSRTAQRCYLKYVPALKFELDETLEQAVRIESLIDEVTKGEDQDPPAGDYL